MPSQQIKKKNTFASTSHGHAYNVMFWMQGYYHKGTALTHLKRHTEAAEAYKQALKLEPRNEEIKTSLSAVNEKLSKLQL